MRRYAIVLTMLLLTPSGGLFAGQTGIASWYGKAHQGKKTASGVKFNMNGFTAAHKSLPFGTKVKVTNLENRKIVVVTITDRGPFVKGRIIDLSHAAAKQLDIAGVGKVKLEVRREPTEKI